MDHRCLGELCSVTHECGKIRHSYCLVRRYEFAKPLHTNDLHLETTYASPCHCKFGAVHRKRRGKPTTKSPLVRRWSDRDRGSLTRSAPQGSPDPWRDRLCVTSAQLSTPTCGFPCPAINTSRLFSITNESSRHRHGSCTPLHSTARPRQDAPRRKSS